MRYPAVAGRFYEADEAALRAQVEACYTHPHGPGSVAKVAGTGPREVRGLVCPHAGLMYSGPVAAHAYASLAADGWPDTVVIFGPNHSGTGAPVALAATDFQTPLGRARVDLPLAERMLGGVIERDTVAHRREHSIEVQLPFLLHLNPDLKFIPICIGFQEIDVAREVGKTVGRVLRGKDAVVIASTDFSHYVSKEQATRMDRLVIDEILKPDVESFYRTKTQHDISMCGYGPVIAMLTALGDGKPRLLKYATSGDMEPMQDVVGYAAMDVR